MRATSRGAWRHALDDTQQKQQQRERSWREQIGSLLRQPGALWSGNITERRGGTGLVKVVNLFLRWIHLSIEIMI